MPQHDDLVLLRHMLDHAVEAVSLIEGHDRESLNHDRLLELAITRLIEVIGEAASHVSKVGEARYASIPWRQITGMRHRLIHGYSEVDKDVLWKTATTDLPPLIAALTNVLGQPE
jgi:uncharacterized protein with HEPN domain